MSADDSDAARCFRAMPLLYEPRRCDAAIQLLAIDGCCRFDADIADAMITPFIIFTPAMPMILMPTLIAPPMPPMLRHASPA
jgi:hypothetical protein